MISEEDFATIVTAVSAGDPITTEQATLLIQSLAELDIQTAVLDAALGYSLETAQTLLNEVGQQTANVIGIRDMAKRRKIAEISGTAAGQLQAAVGLFIGNLVQQAQGIGGSAVSDGEEVTDDETTASPVVPSDD